MQRGKTDSRAMSRGLAALSTNVDDALEEPGRVSIMTLAPLAPKCLIQAYARCAAHEISADLGLAHRALLQCAALSMS